MNVLDASALLAFVLRESGADIVAAELDAGAYCSAANWSEVAQKIQSAGGDWRLVSALLLSYPLTIEPVSVADAERAAALWKRGSGLSLGDRLCLALADRLNVDAYTADAAWLQHHRRTKLIRGD